MIPPPPASSNPDVATDGDASTLADTLALRGRHHPPANRRTSGGASRLQSITMVASTLAAAVFCILYINKPVIITTPDGVIEAPVPVASGPQVAATPEPAPPPVEVAAPQPTSSTRQGHEETNLRVQHVLSASTPEGDLSRIVLDVPVLYPSRSLRWTEAEVARARGILARVADYHEQSRNLRGLGAEILGDWNELIERSIPAAELRADSPSLPTNQEDASRMPRPAALDTNDAIEIRPTEP